MITQATESSFLLEHFNSGRQSQYPLDASTRHKPPTNHLVAVLLVAILEGYQHRRHDPPSGHQIMWRGYERLSNGTFGYELAEQMRARRSNVQKE